MRKYRIYVSFSQKDNQLSEDQVQNILGALLKKWEWFDAMSGEGDPVWLEGEGCLEDYQRDSDFFDLCCLVIWKAAGKYVDIFVECTNLEPNSNKFFSDKGFYDYVFQGNH